MSAALFTATPRSSTLNLGGVLPAVYMGVADWIVGLGSYMHLLKRWIASVVPTYAYINPIVGLALSHLVLHESINAQKLAGAAVLLVSVPLIREDGRMTAWLRPENRLTVSPDPVGFIGNFLCKFFTNTF